MYADFVTRVCTSKKQSNFSIYSFDALANSTLNPMELSGFFWFLKSKIEATHNNYRIIDHKLVADVRIYNVLQFIGFD